MRSVPKIGISMQKQIARLTSAASKVEFVEGKASGIGVIVEFEKVGNKVKLIEINKEVVAFHQHEKPKAPRDWPWRLATKSWR
jgi:hypothetical protein